MIGVGERARSDMPRCIPFQSVFIHKQAHQFGDSNRRMGVVHLDSKRPVEFAQGAVLRLLYMDNVLERAGDEEELLFKAQLFALNLFVVRIKDLGDVFGIHLVCNGANEVARVERFQS